MCFKERVLSIGYYRKRKGHTEPFPQLKPDLWSPSVPQTQTLQEQVKRNQCPCHLTQHSYLSLRSLGITDLSSFIWRKGSVSPFLCTQELLVRGFWGYHLGCWVHQNQLVASHMLYLLYYHSYPSFTLQCWNMHWSSPEKQNHLYMFAVTLQFRGQFMEYLENYNISECFGKRLSIRKNKEMR